MRKPGPSYGLGVAIVVGACLLVSARPHAQFEKMLSTTYDGWTKLPDGSFELVFGYMNRNSTGVDVPLGAANQVEPATKDHGQPTHFLPGRQRDAFRIAVPAGFKGKFVWTITYAGATQLATGSLDQNYSLDVGDPEPPTVKGGHDLSVRLAAVASLAPVVGAPPLPPAPAANSEVVARRASGRPLAVWWSKFRGPGDVTFGQGERLAATAPGPTGREVPMGTFRLACTNPPEAGCGTTTARFSVPGTYWLRVVAAERSASNSLVKVVVAP